MTTSTIPDFEIRIQDLLIEYFTELYEDVKNYLDKRYKKCEKLKKKWLDEHLWSCFKYSRDDNLNRTLYEFKDFSDWLIDKGEDCENLIGTVKNTLYLLEKIDTYQCEFDCPLEMRAGITPEVIIDCYREMFVDEKEDTGILELIDNTICPK